jgi:hypothetical protein
VEERVNLGKPGEFLLDGIFDCIHEITVALSFPNRMSDSLYKVETTPRLAQWRIENLASCTYRKSDPFKIGNWNWSLSLYPSLSMSENTKKVFIFNAGHLPSTCFVIAVNSSELLR